MELHYEEFPLVANRAPLLFQHMILSTSHSNIALPHGRIEPFKILHHNLVIFLAEADTL